MVKPKIKEGHISELTFDPNNARKRTQTSAGIIRRSLEQFGGCRSIVVDENNTVRAGNGTLEEAGQLGIEKVIIVEASGNELVAVKRAGLTEEQWKRYAIADNTASDFSTWDIEVLSELAQEVDLEGFFPSDKLEELLGTLGDSSGIGSSQEEDDDELNELLDKVDEIESRVKLGDIWECGRHRISCGDSTIKKNVRALLGDRFDNVGMVWSDPPYGVNEECNRKEKGRGSFSINSDFPQIIGDENNSVAITAWQVYRDLSKMQIWWGANYYPETLPPISSWLVWDKRDGVPSDDNADCELAWTSKGKPARIFRHLWKGCVKASEHGEKRVHPTQKPVALCEWCFEKYGNDNDLIVDPFLGSAPSIIAAQKMEGDRTVYGFELSPQYCTVILDRFSKFTGITPELIGHLPT